MIKSETWTNVKIRAMDLDALEIKTDIQQVMTFSLMERESLLRAFYLESLLDITVETDGVRYHLARVADSIWRVQPNDEPHDDGSSARHFGDDEREPY